MASEKETTIKETDRLEFFSDGVFAIAITLLVIEIKVPTEIELHAGLTNALICKWPNYLAFFIGFFTTLVCWINHHFIFKYISKSSAIFNIVNALILFVVVFVQFPTAVLAEFITHPDSTIAVRLYAVTYIMMACAYRFTWGFACRNGLNSANATPEIIKCINTMYNLGIIHTTFTFFVSFFCLPLCLFLYIPLFSMFMVPPVYCKLIKTTKLRLQKKQLKK